MQDLGCSPDRFFRVNRTVRFNLHYKLVQIGALLNSSILHGVRYATNRTVRSVKPQDAYAAGFTLFSSGVNDLITATITDGNLHIQLAICRKAGQKMVWIYNFDIMIELNIRGGYDTWPLLRHPQYGFISVMHRYRETFEVQQNRDHIFLCPGDGVIFMTNAFNFYFRNGCAGHRGQQNSTERISKRIAKTPLEGFQCHSCTSCRYSIHINHIRLKKFFSSLRH